MTSSNLSSSLSDHERPGVPPPKMPVNHRHEVVVTDADLRSMFSSSTKMRLVVLNDQYVYEFLSMHEYRRDETDFSFSSINFQMNRLIPLKRSLLPLT